MPLSPKTARNVNNCHYFVKKHLIYLKKINFIFSSLQAGKECRKLGNAELASVLDSDANGRLAEILNGNTWIGGQNNVSEQCTVCLHTESCIYSENPYDILRGFYYYI